MIETEMPTHRHVKRGTEYAFLGYGTYISHDPAADDADVYVLQAGPGVWHVRWAFAELKGAEWARVQCAGSVKSGDVVAIYRAIGDGFLWVRPREEFEDGRFIALGTTP